MKYLFYIVIVITAISCGNSTNQHNHSADIHQHEGGHSHTTQFTAYSKHYEVFADADVFILGESATVLSHISSLPELNPLSNGSVTIKLTVDGETVKHTLHKPTRKGIYKFKLTPTKAGKGKLVYSIATDMKKREIVVPDINVFADHSTAHAAEAPEVSKTNTVVFTKEQSWKIDFRTANPKISKFGQVIKTTAQIQSAQDDEIVVSAKTNGIVQLGSQNVLEGFLVTTGQTLFNISGSGFAQDNLSVQYLEAKNNYEIAKTEYERHKVLAEDKIVSVENLQITKNHYENAKVQFENLKKNFSLKGQNGTSPMDGYIKQLHVKNGEYVAAGQAIVSITRNKNLLLQADVQQKYASILSTIDDANIHTVHNNKTYTLAELNGAILSYGRNTNADNYLIPIALQIENTGDFFPGEFVEVYLKTVSSAHALTVPNSALIEEQGFFFVYAQITPELFEKREIKLGATDGFRTEITQGISANERIVTKGAILIKLAQATGALDPHAGHVH